MSTQNPEHSPSERLLDVDKQPTKLWDFVPGHRYVSRMRVPGGWLYRVDRDGATALAFVPEGGQR